jgi:hypothetical protein
MGVVEKQHFYWCHSVPATLQYPIVIFCSPTQVPEGFPGIASDINLRLNDGRSQEKVPHRNTFLNANSCDYFATTY